MLDSKPLTLIDLPPDVALMIIAWLDLQDIFAMRMSCKSFYTISYERSVWSTALAQLPDIPRPLYLLKPLYLHSNSELEELAIKFYRVGKSWRKEGAKPARAVEINPPYAVEVNREGSVWTQIMPGGRWLVTVGKNTSPSAVYYWDLDEIQPRDSLLFDTKDIISPGEISLSVSYFADTEEYYKIYLAILTSNSGSFTLYLWNVIFNHEQEILEAVFVKSFTFFAGWVSPNISWNTKYLGVETNRSIAGPPTIFNAFEWRKCRNGELHVSSFIGEIQNGLPAKAQLLPCDRVLLVCSDAVHIYQLPESQVVPDLRDPWNPVYLPAVWKLGGASRFGRTYSISLPTTHYQARDEFPHASLTMMNGSICTIKIPPNPASPLGITREAIPRPRRVLMSCFGLQRAVILFGARQLALFDMASSTNPLSWVEPPIEPLQPKHVEPGRNRLGLVLTFDEQSGRVAVQTQWNSEPYRVVVYYF